MPAQPSHALADFLTSTDDLVQANHAFFSKREISPVAHKDQREAAMSSGLAALARFFNVTLKAPLQVNSNGEFMLAVEQLGDGVATINPYNGARVFGAAFAELLNAHSPRTGISPSAVLTPEGAWCYMNHFSVEKMLLAAAERLKSEALGSESLRAGLEIVTVKGELDQDEEGQERVTPPGSVGVLAEQSMPGQWEVHFGDAAVHIGEGDLFNPAEYRLRSHFRAEAKALLEDLGVTIAEDSDQAGLWVWYAPSEGCDSSFASEWDAIDDALAQAMEQSRSILSVPPDEWARMPLDQRLESVRSAMSGESPAVGER